MGSPITFSGFNQIDFNAILNAVMAQERQKIDRLDTQRKALDTQKTLFGTLSSKLGAVQSALTTLKDDDSLSLLTATSSSTNVGVATTTGTVSGTYDLVVTALARSQVLSSDNTFASLDTEVGTGGTFTISGASGDTVITLSGATTLQALADKINAEDDAPARAAVVRTAAGAYRLVLTAAETGSSGAFTVTDALTGSALDFSDLDDDGVAGDDDADNTRTAQDAALTVNGVAVTSASNVVEDVIPGVRLTLKKADPAESVVVDVGRDIDAAADRVKKFVTAYNDLQTFMKAQDADAVAGKTSIGRDPLLRGFRDTVRRVLQAQYGDAGTLNRLGAAGIGFDMGGTMTLNRTVFDAALRAEPAAVQTLFSGEAGNGGAFGTLADVVDDYTRAGGLVADARDRMDTQMKAIRSRMDDLEAQLAVRRAALQKEYIAADQAMSQLNNQSSSLNSLAGQYRLF